MKDSERCLIIDVAIPRDYNIQKKATEKMSKYVDLQIECQRMWHKKVEVISIIIETILLLYTLADNKLYFQGLNNQPLVFKHLIFCNI